MIKLKYVVESPDGIHARPAALLANSCVNYKSSVTLLCNGKKAEGNNVLSILALGANKGDEVEFVIDGEDEVKTEAKIRHLLDTKFNRDDKPDQLNIVFFGTKSYDRTFFEELAKDKGEGTYNVNIKFLKSRLTLESVSLAEGFDAVCIFVNDECGKDIVERLHGYGIKLILLRCAGFNNVDLNACKECGITVLRVPAYSPYAVAEHAMATLQEANRRLNKAYNKIRENNFDLSGLLGLDLHNKVAGIMGTGKIGVCMANICKGYGMTVLGWDAYPNKELEESGLLTYVTKEELLQRSDLISLHAPLIMGEGGTYHLINKETIALMKDNAMLVNTARGGLIDAEALINALKSNKFHAVALDVYEGEDPNVYTDRSGEVVTNDITGRLLMFPQVVLTSHQAFFTREALQAIATTTMENARNFAAGKDYGAAEVKAK